MEKDELEQREMRKTEGRKGGERQKDILLKEKATLKHIVL